MKRGALDWRLGLIEAVRGLGRRPGFGGVVRRPEVGVGGLGHVGGLGWRLGLNRLRYVGKLGWRLLRVSTILCKRACYSFPAVTKFVSNGVV
jgi:hypothetical protein